MQTEADQGQTEKFVNDLLKLMITRKASDLFITAGFPPAMKIDGKLTPVSTQTLSPQQTAEIAQAVMSSKQAQEFKETLECNFAISMSSVGRFRVNAFIQRSAVGLVFRVINTNIPRFDDLNLPPVLKDVVMAKRGLIIFVGGTGSGKSTSLAAMLGHRNESSFGHIITIGVYSQS